LKMHRKLPQTSGNSAVVLVCGSPAACAELHSYPFACIYRLSTIKKIDNRYNWTDEPQQKNLTNIFIYKNNFAI